MPYSATVVINDIRYGTGYATSKKMAKLEAGVMVINLSLFSLTVSTFSILSVYLAHLGAFVILQSCDYRTDIIND